VIRNIIFDIGEVLLSFRPMEFLQSKFGPGEKASMLETIIFRSKYWQQLDRGTISEQEVKTNLINDFPHYRDEIEIVFLEWPQILQPLPATKLLKPLSEKGYSLFYLSNFHLRAWKIVRAKFDFFSFFKGGIISSEEGLLKPEEEIFWKLLSDFSLKAEECLFIDDRIENICAAEKNGFNSNLYLDLETLEAKLKENKIL